MIVERCRLWGFDGDFDGNDDRIFARLPIVMLPATGELAAADTLYWSPSPCEGLSVFSSESFAAEAGTAIPASGLFIQPGQYVVLAGPDFLVRARSVDIIPPVPPEAMLEDGWMIFLLNDAEYEDLCTFLLARAREVFDFEVCNMRGGLSSRAETALTLLRSNPLTPLQIQQTRSLAAMLIRRDAEGFRTSLQLSAMRLRMPSTILLQRLHEYLRMLGREDPVPGRVSSLPSTEIADEFQRRLKEGPNPFAEPESTRAYVATFVQHYQNALPTEHITEAVDQLFGHWHPENPWSDRDTARLFTLFVNLPTNEGFGALVSYLARSAELERRGAMQPDDRRLLEYTLDLLIENEKPLRSLDSREGRVPAILWDRFMETAWALLPFESIGTRAYELLLQHVTDLSKLLLAVLRNQGISLDVVKELFFRRSDGHHWVQKLERCVADVQTLNLEVATQARLYKLALPDAEAFGDEGTQAFYILSDSVVPQQDEEAKVWVGDEFIITQYAEII